MRHIIVTRDKVKFVGRLISYDCYLNVNKEVFEQYLKRAREDEHSEDEDIISFFDNLKSIPIANGKSVSIEIDEQQNELFVVAFTSTGPSISNLQIIPAGNLDASYFIETGYSWTTGTKLLLRTESADIS